MELTDKQKKEKAIGILRKRYDEQREQVAAIDDRMTEYYEWMLSHVSADPDDENDLVNYYELLCAVKFLRLLRTYQFNYKKVTQVIRLREGVWEKNSIGQWQHISGGMKCPSTTGAQVFRWEPFQVFVLASIFGFYAHMSTGLKANARPLLLTEDVVDDEIYDTRRLCTDFTYYAPRKSDKTGLAAFIQVVFFLLEDFNSEIYCAANASDQAKLLYRRTKDLLRSIDNGQRIRMTETVCDWRPAYKAVRDSSIRPLSAGGKAKDGMFAQLCCADEYGSAAYVNGKADMKMLVDVITSSMGPRREPIVLTTTTAGRITSGPFIEKLDALHHLLEKELEFDNDATEAGLVTDRTLCILYEPDAWERDEHYLLTSRKVRAKVNRMLGIIVQHQFYDDEAAKAMLTGDSSEFISKFLNVYKATTVQEWITPDEVRKLQSPSRIDDLRPVDGTKWLIFTGMDFSLGDDFYAHSYLALNTALPAPRRFFADLDAWMCREALNRSPLKSLFELWEKQGWLHVVEGSTVPPEVSHERIAQLVKLEENKCALLMAFGYDPYASKIPINALKSYIQSLGGDPDNQVLPCRQTMAAFNSSVDELGYMIKSPQPWITFSNSPLWPFEAGNMILEEDPRMGNKKPMKRAGSSGKIDNFIALLMGLQLFDLFDGKNAEI